ncbi:MAG: two-component regulator propeller domain-containing protein [Phycisphaerae bacterium]
MAWLAFASLTASLPGADEKSGPGAETHYHATRWTPEDGLPQMRISALAQTPDGYLWAGTWFGLARFDGVRFVVFNGVNTPEFKKESITALAADRADGTLWIGTPEGVVLLKDRRFTRLADKHELTNAVVVALVSSSTGGVWVWTQDTVELWRGRTSIRVPFTA